MKLGMVTYQWGADWDLPTIFRNCTKTGFEGVELRTTHKHGVEVTLNKQQRADVQKRFADSRIELVGLGSTCEFHSPDPAVVKKNIELRRKSGREGNSISFLMSFCLRLLRKRGGFSCLMGKKHLLADTEPPVCKR